MLAVKGTVNGMLMDYRDSGYMHDGAGAGFWVMVVMMLLVLVAVLAFLYLLVTRSGAMAGRESAGAAPKEAERLLDERFARGEIDEDEYRRRRAVLHGG
jgi:putative membrane protein